MNNFADVIESDAIMYVRLYENNQVHRIFIGTVVSDENDDDAFNVDLKSQPVSMESNLRNNSLLHIFMYTYILDKYYWLDLIVINKKMIMSTFTMVC